jgi:hypothetical protein
MDVLASHVLAVPVRMSFPFWITLIIGTTYQFWYFVGLPENQTKFWTLLALRVAGVFYVIWAGITFSGWIEELTGRFRRTGGQGGQHQEKNKRE